jgi:phage gp36-like protein
MPYCDVATILKVNPELPQVEADPGYTRVTEIIDTVTIPKAESLINAMLCTRYSIPFNPVPRLITALAVDQTTVFTDSELDQGAGEKAESDARYERALKTLSEIKSGFIPLVDETTGELLPEKDDGDRDSGGIYTVRRYDDESIFTMEDPLL